jgi:hypothetical protein
VAYADQEMARLEAEGLDYLRAVDARRASSVAVVLFHPGHGTAA